MNAFGTLLGVGITLSAVAAQGAMLSGTITDPNPNNPTDVSAVGTVDWAVWGADSNNSLTPYARKDAGGNVAVGIIPSLSLIGSYTPTAMSQWDIGNLVDLSWSGGVSPNSSATASQNPSLAARAVDNGTGFSLSLPALLTPQRAYIFVTGYSTKGVLNASISGTAATYTGEVETRLVTENTLGTEERSSVFVLDYQGDAANQTLDIAWVRTNSNNPFANLGVQAIAIGAVPEPGVMGLAGAGLVGLLARRRRA